MGPTLVQGVKDAVAPIVNIIVNPVIILLFAIAFIYFLWGVIVYMWKWESVADRQAGQMHMLWGVVGMAIMLSAFGILNFIFKTVVTDTTGNTGINNSQILPPVQGK